MEGTRGSPFFGRSGESAALSRYADTAREGNAQVVFVAGPPGIGKTALVERLLDTRRDWTVLRIAGTAAEIDLPFAVVNRLIAKVHGWTGADLTGNVGEIPLGASVMAAGGALIEALDEAGTDAPLALVVEDAHAMDEKSLSTIGFALLRLRADRMLTIVTTGHASHTRKAMGLLGQAQVVHQLELRGLGSEDVRALITAHGFPSPSESRLTRLLEWSDGNPLHLQTALGALSSDRLPESPAGLDVPESMAASVGEWHRSFPEAGRGILEALTVLNTPASLPLLHRLVDSDTLADDIKPLVSEGAVNWVARAALPVVELAHPSQREALYAAIPQADRQRLHRAAAEALEPPASLRHRLAAVEDYDAHLADDLREAAESEAARGELPLAAELYLGVSNVDPDSARRQVALLRAVRLFVVCNQYRSALGCRDRVAGASASPERSEALGLLCYAEGQDAAACEHLRLATEGYTEAGASTAAAQASVELSTVQGSIGLAGQSYASADFALSHSTDPTVVGLARANRARSRGLTDGFNAGLDELAYLSANPAEVAEPDLDGLTYRGLFRAMSGRLTDALSDLAVAERRRSPVLNRISGCAALVTGIWCRIVLGELQEARRGLSIGFDLAQTLGRPVDFASLHGLSAVLYAATGQSAAAEADLAEAAELARNSDFAGPAFHQLIAAAVTRSFAGDHEAAVEFLAEATSNPANRLRKRLYAIWYLPALGVSCARTARVDQAVEAVATLERLDSNGALIPVVIHWVQGNSLVARGDPVAAAKAFRRGLRIPSDGGEPRLYRSLLRRDFGAALIASGNTDEARRQLLTAKADLRAQGAEACVSQCAALLDEIDPKARTEETDKLWESLTDREKDIAKLVARGWTNKEMAAELYVSSKTVEYHLSNIYDKGQVRNRRQLRDRVQSFT